MTSPLVISDASFETEVLKADKPVLAYFWATWCGPCRLVSPSIEALAETYADRLKIVKLEVDPNPISVKTYKVEGVPALRFFKAGEEVERSEGAMTKDKIVKLIEGVLA
ncbi:MAG: thioredoxin [Oscillatoriales cyanobacterium]|jgi:thioredoxin 1|nr:MAG: thioredoxin [Oscillatoriales cyanobacterium]